MNHKTSLAPAGRAKRFVVCLPVYFRPTDSSSWSKGTTENISATGVLFHASSALDLETEIELRMRVKTPTEIRSKGKVVRQEERSAPDAPIALAVAMHDVTIVRLDGPHGTAFGAV